MTPHIHEVDAAERARALSEYGRYVGGFAISGKAPTLVFDGSEPADMSLQDALWKAHCAKLRAHGEMQHINHLRGDIRQLREDLQHYRFGPDEAPEEGARLITVPIGGNDTATVAYCPEDREFVAVWTAWGWLRAPDLSDAKRDDFQSRLDLVL